MDALNTPCQASSSSTSSSSSSSSSTSSKLEEENMNTLKTNTFESRDEEVFTPSKAKKWKVLSSSENDIEKDENTSDEEKLFSYVNDEKPPLKKFKIQQRCVDSSDEENDDLNVGLMKPSKVEREKKLLRKLMRN